jgi:hypothetical protein
MLQAHPRVAVQDIDLTTLGITLTFAYPDFDKDGGLLGARHLELSVFFSVTLNADNRAIAAVKVPSQNLRQS